MTKICDFPNTIYDLTKNLIPWPDQALNGVEEGTARWEKEGVMKK